MKYIDIEANTSDGGIEDTHISEYTEPIFPSNDSPSINVAEVEEGQLSKDELKKQYWPFFEEAQIRKK